MGAVLAGGGADGDVGAVLTKRLSLRVPRPHSPESGSACTPGPPALSPSACSRPSSHRTPRAAAALSRRLANSSEAPLRRCPLTLQSIPYACTASGHPSLAHCSTERPFIERLLCARHCSKCGNTSENKADPVSALRGPVA